MSVVRMMGALAALLLLCENATSDFINNFGQWQKTSPEAKYGYAMGAYDQLVRLHMEATLDAIALGIGECGAQNGLNAGMLVSLIEKYYSKTPKNWKYAPFFALEIELEDLCKET